MGYDGCGPHLSKDSSFESFQACVFKLNQTSCPLPCNPKGETTPKAPVHHGDEKVGFSRLGKSDHTVNGRKTVKVIFTSKDECKGWCEKEKCVGVEYHASEARCELWTKPIRYHVVASGYECIPFSHETREEFHKDIARQES